MKLGLWSHQLWYQCPLWTLTLLMKRDPVFFALKSFIFKICLLLPPLLVGVWTRLGRKWLFFDLNWLICMKLGSWSHQLWYQCPLWTLTLLMKWDSFFLHWNLSISKFVSSFLLSWLLFELDSGETGYFLFWIDWFAWNWDGGRINCGSNALCGHWLSWWNEILFFFILKSFIFKICLLLPPLLVVVWTGLGRNWLLFDLIWLICMKLGLWLHQLW